MINATLINHRNDDMLVVDAARASMGRTHDQYTPEQNKRLLNYLAAHQHWSPFSHPRFTFQLLKEDIDLYQLKPNDVTGMVWDVGNGDLMHVRHSFYGWINLIFKFDLEKVGRTLQQLMPQSMDAYKIISDDPYDLSTAHNHPDFIDETFLCELPISIARQEFKHQVGFTRNEISRRYVTDNIRLYDIDIWRSKPADDIKQGSGDPLGRTMQTVGESVQDQVQRTTYGAYSTLIENGFAAEQARMMLPQSMIASYYNTGSIAAWKRLINQRLNDTTAQREIRDFSAIVKDQLVDKYGENIEV